MSTSMSIADDDVDYSCTSFDGGIDMTQYTNPLPHVLPSLLLSSLELRSRFPIFKSNAETIKDPAAVSAESAGQPPHTGPASSNSSSNISSSTTTSSTSVSAALSDSSGSPAVNIEQGLACLPYLRARECYGSVCSPWAEWCVRSLCRDFCLEHHSGCVNTVRWNADGDLLVSGSDDQRLAIWRPLSEKKKLVDSWRSGHRNNVFHAIFHPNNANVILSCALDGQIRVNDFLKRKSRVFRCHDASCHKIGLICDDSNALLSCSDDGTVRFFDLRQSHRCTSNCKNVLVNCHGIREQSGGNTFSFQRNHSVQLHSLCVHPIRSERFAIAGRDIYVREYDRRKLTSEDDSAKAAIPIALYRPPLPSMYQRSIQCGVTSTVYSNDGEFLAASYSADAIYLFDCSHTKFDSRIGDDSYIFAPTMQMQTQTAAEEENKAQPKDKEHENSSETSSTIAVLNENTDNMEEDDKSPTKSTKRIRQSIDSDDDSHKDGEKKLKRTGDSQAERAKSERFTIQPQSAHRHYRGHISRRTVKECNFLGDRSQYVCSGSDDGFVYIWSRNTGKLLNRFHADEDVVNVVQANPNHNLVAVSGIEDTIKIFSPAESLDSNAFAYSSSRPANAQVNEDAALVWPSCVLDEETALKEEKCGYLPSLTDDISWIRALEEHDEHSAEVRPSVNSSDEDNDDEDEDELDDDNGGGADAAERSQRRGRGGVFNLFRLLPADMFRMVFGLQHANDEGEDDDDDDEKDEDEEQQNDDEKNHESGDRSLSVEEKKVRDGDTESEPNNAADSKHSDEGVPSSARRSMRSRHAFRLLSALMESGLAVRVEEDADADDGDGTAGADDADSDGETARGDRTESDGGVGIISGTAEPNDDQTANEMDEDAPLVGAAGSSASASSSSSSSSFSASSSKSNMEGSNGSN